MGIDSVFTLKRRNELKVDARRPHYVHLQPTQTARLYDQDDYVLSSCYSHSLTAHHTSQPQCMPSQFSSAAQLAARLDDHDMQGASSCRHSLEFSWQKFWPAVSSLIVDTTVHTMPLWLFLAPLRLFSEFGAVYKYPDLLTYLHVLH